MKKSIEKNKVFFHDDENHEIMFIEHSLDECIWYFYSNDVIVVSPDMELYDLIAKFMSQNYVFGDAILENYKDNNSLIWYSDCYYNPDDDWSVASVTCLHIEKSENVFKIWCTKKLDDIIGRFQGVYCVCFSPLGNGQNTRNINTGLTLQDDFVTYVYRPLLDSVSLKREKR